MPVVNQQNSHTLPAKEKLEEFLRGYRELDVEFTELANQAKFLKREMLQLLDKQKQKELLEHILDLPN